MTRRRPPRFHLVWREPPVQSSALYPGLTVDDDLVSGSIVVGVTRLPLWCFVPQTIIAGWPDALESYPQLPEYAQAFGFGPDQCAAFVYWLLEQRGEFGRLLLLLADVERRECARNERNSEDERMWCEVPKERRRVLAQLRRCVAALELLEHEQGRAR